MLFRMALGATTVIGAVVLLTSCADDPTGPAPSAVRTDSSTSTSVETAEHEQVQKVAAIQACRQVITSAGVMVRDYNAFLTTLNRTQSYEAISSEDKWAMETLRTGADLVKGAMLPETPRKIVTLVQRFATSSTDLADAIASHERTGLNEASELWSKRRTAALDKCAEYLPSE